MLARRRAYAAIQRAVDVQSTRAIASRFGARQCMRVNFSCRSPLRQTTKTDLPATKRTNPTQQLLVAQRRLRPISPHLSVYRLSVNYVTSGLHRISGAILSGTFYIFFSTYLIAPLFGWHLDSATIIAAFGAWPTAAKIGTKAIIALPFTFHVANGIRFLILDTGSHFTREMIVRVGWVTIGVSIVSAVALAMVGNEETK